MRETWVRSLGWEDPLEKETATQYSCLENPMDGGAWWTTVHGVAKSQTQLSYFTHTHTHTHTQLVPIRLFFLSFYELVCYGKCCRGVGFSPYTKNLHQLKKPLFKYTNCESCLCNTASYFKMFWMLLVRSKSRCKAKIVNYPVLTWLSYLDFAIWQNKNNL